MISTSPYWRVIDSATRGPAPSTTAAVHHRQLIPMDPNDFRCAHRRHLPAHEPPCSPPPAPPWHAPPRPARSRARGATGHHSSHQLGIGRRDRHWAGRDRRTIRHRAERCGHRPPRRRRARPVVHRVPARCHPGRRRRPAQTADARRTLGLRGNQLVDKPAQTRRHRVPASAARTIAALLTVRDQVIVPILAGIRSPRMGRKPKAGTRSTATTNSSAPTGRPLDDLALTTPAPLAG